MASKLYQRRTISNNNKYINSCVRFTQLTNNIRIIFKFISNDVPKITKLVNIFQRMTIKCTGNTRKIWTATFIRSVGRKLTHTVFPGLHYISYDLQQLHNKSCVICKPSLEGARRPNGSHFNQLLQTSHEDTSLSSSEVTKKTISTK